MSGTRRRSRIPWRAVMALAALFSQPCCKQPPHPISIRPPRPPSRRPRPRSAPKPVTGSGQEAALRLAPAGARVDLAVGIPVRELSIPLLALSSPVDEPVNPYLAVGKDYVLKLMVFLARDPTVIGAHPFLRPTAPADDIWEDIGCGKLKLLPLGKDNRVPVVLAQNCWHEEESLYHYAIFDETCLAKPKTGTATWSFSAYPDAPHEDSSPTTTRESIRAFRRAGATERPFSRASRAAAPLGRVRMLSKSAASGRSGAARTWSTNTEHGSHSGNDSNGRAAKNRSRNLSPREVKILACGEFSRTWIRRGLLAGRGQNERTFSSALNRLAGEFRILGKTNNGPIRLVPRYSQTAMHVRLLPNGCRNMQSELMQLCGNSNAAIRPVVRGMQFHLIFGQSPLQGAATDFPFLDDSTPHDSDLQSLIWPPGEVFVQKRGPSGF